MTPFFGREGVRATGLTEGGVVVILSGGRIWDLVAEEGGRGSVAGRGRRLIRSPEEHGGSKLSNLPVACVLF